jgi:hypothetical protein
MKATFEWGDNTIDSRDIIARHEELQDEYDSLVEELREAQLELKKIKSIADDLDADDQCSPSTEEWENDVEKAQEALDEFNESPNKAELDTLTVVISQGEDSPDWSYGETLILDSHFTDYTTELINDCYEFPKEFSSGQWPWRHLIMDWESAAEEAKSDYFEIEAEGFTYYIRA